jgi:hypothetical protein
MAELNVFRDFDRLDWMGLAGAEPFEDGSEPRINAKDIEGTNGCWQISIDKNGIEVDFYGEGEDFEMKSYALHRGNMTKLSMERLAANIYPATDNLEELGFERIV